MAKQGGAYYAAAQQARNVKPVDFGAIAKGFAQVQEDRRLEAEKKAKEEEQYQLETLRRYGEDIAAGFDNVGIEDVDSLGVSLKGLIIDKSEELNQMYSDGEIDKRTFELGMMKLKSQSNSYAGFYTSIKDYAESLRADGDFSASDEQMLKRMDLLVKDARPIMDKKGNISFVSVVDGKTTVTPFSQLKNLMQKNDTPDYNGFLEGMVSTEGAQDEYIIDQKTGSLRKSYLTREGDLTDNQKTGISDYVTSLDAFGVANVAGKLGIDVKFSDTDVNSIENEEAVRASVQSELEKLAISKYQRKDVVIEKKKDDFFSGATRAEKKKIMAASKLFSNAFDLLTEDADLSSSALAKLKTADGVKNIFFTEKDGGKYVIQYENPKTPPQYVDIVMSEGKVDRFATATAITSKLLTRDNNPVGTAEMASEYFYTNNKDVEGFSEYSTGFFKGGTPEIKPTNLVIDESTGTYAVEDLERYKGTGQADGEATKKIIMNILSDQGVTQNNNIKATVIDRNRWFEGPWVEAIGLFPSRTRSVRLELLDSNGNPVKDASVDIIVGEDTDEKVKKIDDFANMVMRGGVIGNVSSDGRKQIPGITTSEGDQPKKEAEETSANNIEVPTVEENTEITDAMAQTFIDKYPRSFKGKTLEQVKEAMLRIQAAGGYANAD